MALILRKLYENYDYLFYTLPDSRTDDFPLITSHFKIIALLGSYYWFAKHGGPAMMNERKSFKIDNILIAYNCLQVVANLAFFVLVTPYIFSLNIACAELEHEGMFLPYMGIFYFFLKLADLLDTVFFIMRKKYNQVTFLHVYHHIMIVIIAWLGLRYIPSGHTAYLPYLNTFVHTIMYSYYGISLVNRPFALQWKKLVTQIQLVQFGLDSLIYAMPLLNPSCSYPKTILIVVFPQNFLMLVLFGDFYYRTYVKKKTH